MLSIFSLGSIHADITWNLSSDGTLTISGTDMPNYDATPVMIAGWDVSEYAYMYGSECVPWYSQRDKIKKVVIENGVTNIGNYAFYDCSLTSITIPESVTSIGVYAFWCCSGLTSINIPNSVTTLRAGTFACCDSLTSITIPNSVTSIEGVCLYGVCGCFFGCSSLTSITIPNSVTSIGSSAFSGCI